MKKTPTPHTGHIPKPSNVIGMDFWLTIVGGLIILAVFIPLTVKTYLRKA